MIIELHPENPQKRYIQQAAQVLKNDGVILYPTESGYSVGCSAESPKAIQKLYHLKKPLKKYFMALLMKDLKQVTDYAKINNFAFKIIKSHIPGPYTWILPAHNRISRKLGVKRPEIGIRFSDHVFIEQLWEYFPHPILNTAARVSEDEYFTSPAELQVVFENEVDLMLTMGEVPILPTNIISLVDDTIEVIRGEL
jgi:tRNA threonylcarbamoyl adenosine modification protein (Sua5/YciO/YrdC/YwlC family)